MSILHFGYKFVFSSGGGSGANNIAPAGANANAGGGGSGGTSSEAKLLQRKLKDLETSSKKESKQLEARASKVTIVCNVTDNPYHSSSFFTIGGSSATETAIIAAEHRHRAGCFETRKCTALTLEGRS